MNIDVLELSEKLKRNEDFVFIDVREPYEHEEYSLGADLIPLGELISKIPEINIPKDKEIVVHCRSGNRSEMAQMLFKSAGFENVRNLTGGVLAWKKAFEEA